MKEWKTEGIEFLKQLGDKIGLQMNKSQEEHIDRYLVGATPKMITFSTFDSEMNDYVLNGTQLFDKREFKKKLHFSI